MTPPEILASLTARGHYVHLADDGAVVVSDGSELDATDREAITSNRAELVAILALQRAGRLKGREWLASLSPVGRALHRQLVHENACTACSRGAHNGCDLGQRLAAVVVRLRERRTP